MAKTEPGQLERRLDVRKLTLLWHFLHKDTHRIYRYGPQAQKSSPAPGLTGLPIPRCTPEAQGFSAEALASFYTAVDADAAAEVHAMVVARNGYILTEGYWAPYQAAYVHQLYSMSKSITSAAIGILVDEGLLSLQERIVDIFFDKVENPAHHPMKDVTVWHLLTMSTGARFDEISTSLGTDWEQEFLDAGVLFPPGTHFCYNSLNTYMLSAIVKRKSSLNMMEYLRTRLFEPLHITSASWETCPMGIEKGGWGLSLTMEDVVKIGMLYLNGGVYTANGEEKRLISAKWIRESTRRQIDTPKGECTDGYGYQIWMAPVHGAYLFNGAFGQYLLMLPEQNALVAIFSGSSRMFAQSNLIELLMNMLQHASEAPVKTDAEGTRHLTETLLSLTQKKREQPPGVTASQLPIGWTLGPYYNRRYVFYENGAGLLPFVMQCVQNSFSAGVQGIFLSSDETLHITEGEDENHFPLSEEYVYTTVRLAGHSYAAAVRALTGMDAQDRLMLRLYVHYLETPNMRIITCTFDETSASVVFDERPSGNDAALMLLHLSGITQWEFYRTLLPLLKKEPLKHRLREFSVVKIKGECV